MHVFRLIHGRSVLTGLRKRMQIVNRYTVFGHDFPSGCVIGENVLLMAVGAPFGHWSGCRPDELRVGRTESLDQLPEVLPVVLNGNLMLPVGITTMSCRPKLKWITAQLPSPNQSSMFFSPYIVDLPLSGTLYTLTLPASSRRTSGV